MVAVWDDAPPVRIALGALFRKGDRVLAYRGRAQDRLRQHLFVDDENVPENMTDREFVYGLTNEVLRPTTPQELKREREGRTPKRLALASSSDLEEVARRRSYVQAWLKAERPSQSKRGLGGLIRPVALGLGDASPPSWRTLARWIHQWLSWGEDDEALLSEKGGNRRDRFEGKGRQLLSDTVTEYYCVDTRPMATTVHRAVRNAFDKENDGLPPEAHLPVPSYQAVLDQIAGIDRFTLEYTRKGRRSAEHKFRPVKGGPVVSRHNQAWEIDHTTVDAIVMDDETGMPIGRARVSVCLDRATTYCTSVTMGFEAPSAAVALECLAVGVSPKDKLLATVPGIGPWPCFGAPDEIVSDQGGDFRSASFREACLVIGTDVEHTPVLKAWYRGRIERFFRTLSREVFHRVPGTTFENFFVRNKEAVPESMAVCTLGELWEYTLRFVVDVYNRKPRRALGGRSAEQLWNESVRLHGMKPPPSPQRLRLATSPPMWRTLQRYGVDILDLLYQSAEVASLRVRQDCPRLVKVLMDPQDLTRIRIVHPFTGAEIVVPILPSMEATVRGVSLRKHKLARALQRENPERLAGLEGVAKAYRILDESMRAKQRKGGLRSAMEAARYWESLVRVRSTEEPPVTDPAASGRSFVDAVLDGEEEFDVAADAPPGGPLPEAPTEEEAIIETAIAAELANMQPGHTRRRAARPDSAAETGSRKRVRPARVGKAPASPVDVGETSNAEPGKVDALEDLDDLVRSTGLRISERKVER